MEEGAWKRGRNTSSARIMMFRWEAKVTSSSRIGVGIEAPVGLFGLLVDR